MTKLATDLVGWSRPRRLTGKRKNFAGDEQDCRARYQSRRFAPLQHIEGGAAAIATKQDVHRPRATILRLCGREGVNMRADFAVR